MCLTSWALAAFLIALAADDGKGSRFLPGGQPAVLWDEPDGRPFAEIVPLPGEELQLDLLGSEGVHIRVRVRGDVEMVGWLDAPELHARVRRRVPLWSSARRARRLGYLLGGAEVADVDTYRDMTLVRLVDPVERLSLEGWVATTALTGVGVDRADELIGGDDAEPERDLSPAAGWRWTIRPTGLRDVADGPVVARLAAGVAVRQAAETHDGGLSATCVSAAGASLCGSIRSADLAAQPVQVRASIEPPAEIAVPPPIGPLRLVVGYDVALRSGPSSEADPIARLADLLPVEEIRVVGDWMEVRTLAGVVTSGWLLGTDTVPALP